MDVPAPAADELALASGMFEIVTSFLIIAIVAIALLSPLVRKTYRNRVTRLMGLNQVQPRPEAWWQARKDFSLRSADDGGPSAATSQALAEQVRVREIRILRATIAACLAFMVIAVPVAGWANPGAGWIGQLEFAAFAGFLSLWPGMVNLPDRWQRKFLIFGVLVIIALALGLDLIEDLSGSMPSEETEDDDPLWLAALAVALVAGVGAAIFHRRLRGLVLPLGAALLVASLVFALPFVFLEKHIGNCLVAVNTMQDFEGSAVWGAGVAVAGGSLGILALWLGLQAVGGLARLIDRGWLSDLNMTVLMGLLFVAAVMVFGALPDEGPTASAWISFLPLAWVAAAAGTYALVVGRMQTAGEGCALLVLRVFSRDRRQQALLDRIQSRWRYLGAVNQAGGPDLVDLNVGPYECSMFIASRLHDLYLPKALSPEQLRGRLKCDPDREGRFRVNEMFNFNTAWRQNVEQLILLSKTILLDLRGLTAEREGTSFEVGLLAGHGLLSRIVAIGDERTDWAHVESQLGAHGKSLDQLKRVDLASEDHLEVLFGSLLEVASPS